MSTLSMLFFIYVSIGFAILTASLIIAAGKSELGTHINEIINRHSFFGKMFIFLFVCFCYPIGFLVKKK